MTDAIRHSSESPTERPTPRPGLRSADQPDDPPGQVPADTVPVYVISVAAELSGLHPQTLRQYDRLGLVSPRRSAGRGRRYSAHDLAQLRAVQQLTADGVNLAGVKRILALQDSVAELAGRVQRLEAALGLGGRGGAYTAAEQRALDGPGDPAGAGASAAAAAAAHPPPRRYLPVPVYSASTALVLWRPRRRR